MVILYKDFWYLLPQLATIYYAGKQGLRVLTDSEEPVGIPITALVPDIGLAIDVCCSSKVLSVKKYICELNNITYVSIPGQIPENETLEIIRQAFSEAHIYFNSSIDSDLEHLRVKYIQWKKRQSAS